MTCTCPKCDAGIEIERSLVTDAGQYTSCPECKSRFWIGREPYSRRALKKEGKLYCDECGSELTHPIVCTSCGVMYPVYCLVQTSKPPQRKIEKAELSFSFSLRPTRSTYSYSTERAEKSSKALPAKAAVVVLVICSLAYGVFAYKRMKAEQEYSRNFFVLLYEIKTAGDRSVRISADWQAKGGGDQGLARTTPEDAADFTKLNKEIDFVLQKIKDPPKKFRPVNGKLLRLHEVYAPLNALILDPSAPNFASRVSTAENNYRQALQELKASLPEDLAQDLVEAKTKYRGLQDL